MRKSPAHSTAFFRSVVAHVQTNGWTPVGLHLLMGDAAATKFTNLLRNLGGTRLHVVQTLMKRA
jgi:hypothetical protein